MLPKQAFPVVSIGLLMTLLQSRVCVVDGPIGLATHASSSLPTSGSVSLLCYLLQVG